MYHADGSKIYPRRTRSRRTTGPRLNTTSHINKEQLKQLQEAFNLIDQDRDGVISKDDLQTILISLGQKPTDKEVREMLNEVPEVWISRDFRPCLPPEWAPQILKI